MQRRAFIKQSAVAGMALHPAIAQLSTISSRTPAGNLKGPPKPVFIYNDWSSYDELSDNIPLTEELAMKELAEVIRLKRAGVSIDYYLMDAFWFDGDGGYRIWQKQRWPNGPDRWLQSCNDNHIIPGMWFSTNLIFGGGNIILNMIPEWKSSEGKDPGILCLFEGNYLPHLAESLQMWYNKGVRLFKFDFAYFEAVTQAAAAKYAKDEIVAMNKMAFMKMLSAFREKNNDVLIVGYNGFGGVLENTFAPFTKTVDLRWLDVFDTLYSGDPRFSDVPMMNIWRSEDVYHDHQNRQFQFNGLPMRRIDSCAFMNGVTGTCYSRAMQSWKSMLILDLARGGWMNVYHGNMELITEDDAKWFAKLQQLFYHFQLADKITSFGGIPGKAELYGFRAADQYGIVCAVVNPSQQHADIRIPATDAQRSRLLYADGGYTPVVRNDIVTLGPEQLAVVGFGLYASEKYDLGRDESIRIPKSIKKTGTVFTQESANTIHGIVTSMLSSDLRIVLQQFDKSGNPYRTWGGAPPNGKKMDTLLTITANQREKSIKTLKHYDKMIWSGLSWGVAEIEKSSFDEGEPIVIRCQSKEKEPLTLKAEVYAVEY